MTTTDAGSSRRRAEQSRAVGLAVSTAPHVVAQPKVQWPYVHSLHISARRGAGCGRATGEDRGGDKRRAVPDRGFSRAARSCRAFDCFDAALEGHHRGVHGYRILLDREGARGRVVSTVPFGMNPQGMAAWYYQGDGLKLWEEDVRRLSTSCRAPARRSRHRWPDGSGRRSPRSPTARGSRLRIGTGQGGKVYVKAGGTAVLTPAAEIYAALERGVSTPPNGSGRMTT